MSLLLKMHDKKMPNAGEASEKLGWYLLRLLTMQIHRPVSHMALTQPRRNSDYHLSQLKELQPSNQLSTSTLTTATDKDQQFHVPIKQQVEDEFYTIAEDRCLRRNNNRFKPYVNPNFPSLRRHSAPVNIISSVHDLRCLPEYGVHITKEDNLRPYMNRLSSWGVNIFKINDLTNCCPLTAVIYTILNERGIIDKLHLNPRKVVKYCRLVEDHYQRNPYHNAIHGADVAQSIHVLLSTEQLRDAFTDLEVLAAIFAGAVHDVDHPGFTNQFLINSGNDLARLYNNQSVLEQHHLAVAFKLLLQPGCDMLDSLSKKQRQMLRRIVTDMVMATDASKHGNTLTGLKTIAIAHKAKRTDVLVLENYADRIKVLQTIIHLADLSNPTKPLDLYKEWTSRIMGEYWKQGDNERSYGLKVTPICDRDSATVAAVQIKFIDEIVSPLWEAWHDLVYPNACEMMGYLTINREWYKSQISKAAKDDDDSGHLSRN